MGDRTPIASSDSIPPACALLFEVLRPAFIVKCSIHAHGLQQVLPLIQPLIVAARRKGKHRDNRRIAAYCYKTAPALSPLRLSGDCRKQAEQAHRAQPIVHSSSRLMV
jgi:hypothetical protein